MINDITDFDAKRARFHLGWKSFLQDWMIVFLFTALFATCCVTSEAFRAPTNIMNVLRQASSIAIIAGGAILRCS